MELLASKNKIVEDAVDVANAVQFYLISCTSKNEIEQRRAEVTGQIRALIDRCGHTGAKAPMNLLELIAPMEAVIEGGVPSKYN